MRDVCLLYLRSITQQLRNPIWMLVGVSTPLLYLLLFTPLLKSLAGGPGFPTADVLNVFLPGVLSLLAFGSGTGQGFGTIFELQQGVIERLRVTPASRFALLIGPVLATLTLMYFFDLIVVVAGWLFGFNIHIAGLLVMSVLLGLLLILVGCFSIALALITKDISSVAAVVNGLNLPLLLLSGMLLPISLAPDWMKFLAYFNPMYYTVEASRQLALGHIAEPIVWQAFGLLMPLTILVVWWATGVFRRALA